MMGDDINELSEYELIRRKNIEDNYEMMKQLGILFPINITPSQGVRRTRSRKLSDSSLPRSRKSSFSDSSVVSSPRRRSKRIASLNPVEVQFTDDVAQMILGDKNSCQVVMDSEDDDDYEHYFSDNVDGDKENRKRKRISHRHQNSQHREIPSVDEITEDDLKRVCEIVSEKVYSQDGTTCHQCRQKTLDQKTYCRSKECFGVRGQFCGPCLKNRYGESVVAALKDSDWCCPPCRGLCNCSICRTQQGKIPTGQLFHLAQERGYKSVRHFLEKEIENDDDDKIKSDDGNDD